ncbi:MBL fold metallo-hydrolase [Brevundimonas sp. P7753]|uniref:MBL fold metallo-hydrolase n=1 Tax=Brevundimonas sp. P7753 TaxID=2726982 RepID=UPI0015BCF0E3|nr:MBL fold metallo-hydrolase [Brevundimonas sp. P7753]
MIPYVRQFDFTYGRRDQVSPLIQRVIADNPGPFTFTGTGTYIVGRDMPGARVAVIDPGPEDEAHLHALLRAVKGRTVSHILVTHTHRDHAPLSRALAEAVGGAPILAAQPHGPTVHASDAIDQAAMDEDDDADFKADVILSDGDRIEGGGWTLEAMATPGHASNHMAFALREENALFSGDHVMGWSTTVVAPPDGDMTAYMASLERVLARGFSTLWPTHGPAITQVAPFLKAYRHHRLEREAQIMARLAAGDETIAEMVPALYAAVDPRLWPAASLSVLAHLIALVDRGLVAATPQPVLEARYRIL